MTEWKRHTITAALPYANGPLHIGHIAGVYLPADIYARYLRQRGRDVIFICGSDEHGVPITLTARAEGITPQQVVDHYHGMMKQAFQDFGVSFDIYSRTTSPVHKATASDFFKKLYDEGKFTEQETEQYYDAEAGQFLADRYITGTCPNCGNENAYGDQCERCGKSLSPSDLINPHSNLSGSKPVLRRTKNWFLPLDKLQPKINAYLDRHTDWKPNVYGQCKSWLESGDGLQPRSMTRDLDWGVPVPIAGAEGKVLYVWFDAPIGYISATKELLPDSWELYWKKKDTRLIHFIGKDNIVFHCIIFPAMLIEHGDFITADNVPGNEFLNLEGNKLSTSRHWAVWLHEYLLELPGREDELRYVLCSIIPETKDSEFTWRDYQTRVNSELVGILGNLVNRVLVLTAKYFDNQVPAVSTNEALKIFLHAQKSKVEDSLEQFRFREALTELMNIARYGNQLLSEREPWKTFKTDPVQTASVLTDCLQIIANISILAEPFLPFSARRICAMLGVDTPWSWDHAGRIDLLPTAHTLGTAALLYQKVEDEVIEAQIAKLHATTMIPDATPPVANELPPVKPEMSYDDFLKMDLRVGTILTAQKVEKADKLLQLTVDIGTEVRTIVSGIAAHFDPATLPTTQVCVVANLAPRKIRGIESCGMLLLAEDSAGKLHFISPADITAVGSVIR